MKCFETSWFTKHAKVKVFQTELKQPSAFAGQTETMEFDDAAAELQFSDREHLQKLEELFHQTLRDRQGQKFAKKFPDRGMINEEPCTVSSSVHKRGARGCHGTFYIKKTIQKFKNSV